MSTCNSFTPLINNPYAGLSYGKKKATTQNYVGEKSRARGLKEKHQWDFNYNQTYTSEFRTGTGSFIPGEQSATTYARAINFNTPGVQKKVSPPEYDRSAVTFANRGVDPTNSQKSDFSFEIKEFMSVGEAEKLDGYDSTSDASVIAEEKELEKKRHEENQKGPPQKSQGWTVRSSTIRRLGVFI